MKIRTGDIVLIISGKDRGKSGTVERVLASDGRIVVSGINMRTKHIKKTTQQAGRKIRFEASIAIGKVMLLDPKSGKPTRAGFMIKDGKKTRIARLSGEEIKKMKPKVEKKTAKKETDVAEGKKVSATRKEKEIEAAAPPTGEAKSQPFWKRMKFGSAAMEHAEVPEQSNMEKDHSIPSQEIHVRKGARGS